MFGMFASSSLFFALLAEKSAFAFSKIFFICLERGFEREREIRERERDSRERERFKRERERERERERANNKFRARREEIWSEGWEKKRIIRIIDKNIFL